MRQRPSARQSAWPRPSRQTLRRELARYFGGFIPPTDRALDELPSQLVQLGEWEWLKRLLADASTFLRLNSDGRWEWELHAYWAALRPHYRPDHVYREALESYRAVLPA